MIAVMTGDLGLRERKKRQTRRLIEERAFELFAERGFDNVPVAEIAVAADVSEATVFNYFPSKEDLVYESMEEYQRHLFHQIRERPAHETVLATFGRMVIEPGGLLTDQSPDAEERLHASVRIVSGSPHLLDREQRTFDKYTETLASLIAAEAGVSPDDPEPWVVANALLGVQKAILRLLRRTVMAGEPRERIIALIRAHGSQAMALLENGLADYPGYRRRTSD